MSESASLGKRSPGALRSRPLRVQLQRFWDLVFVNASRFFGLLLILLIGWIGIQLYLDSSLTRHRYGLGMITHPVWDVPHEVYGASTFIFGTLLSSFVALVVAIPIGIGAALFLTELAPKWLAAPIAFVVELLAAVPSIVYGLWGFTVMCPFLQAHVNPWLSNKLGANPIFGGPPVLTNVLAAGLVLAIMIMPFITAVSREVIRTVPVDLRAASLGLGSTRWETIKNVVLPSSKAGIGGACILGLGRAVGETMAVVMVIGNTPQIKASLLQPAYTMSGLLANQFNEAFTEKLQRSALLEVALILFVITLVINALAQALIVAVKGELTGKSRGNPRLMRVRHLFTSSIRNFGQWFWLVALAGLLILQFYSDIRAHGVAGLARGFELCAYLAGAAYVVSRVRPVNTRSVRRATEWVSRALFGTCGFLACFVLGAVLYYVTVQGVHGLTPQLFTQLPRPPGVPGGGLKSAIAGTVELVLIAGAVGIPIGLLAGIYAAEFSRGAPGRIVRFAADVLNGIPSVVIGLFAYAAFVLPFGHFSAWAGGLALAVIMIPTVARTTEDMLRLVPSGYREGAMGLGASQGQAIRMVILPAARAGILTGIMLGVARIAGETAPLLFTAFGSDVMNLKPSEPVSSLTMKVYQYAISPYDDWVAQAWAGALVLLLFVFTLNLGARLLASRSRISAFA